MILRQDATWDKDELKRRVDLREIVAEAWGPGRRSDKATMYHAVWRGDDRHPSFAVYENGYKDFGGAGESGDVYNWLEREFGMTFAEALQWLHERVYGPGYRSNHGLSDGSTARQPLASQLPPAPPMDEEPAPLYSWLQAATDVLYESQDYLWSGAADAQRALDYLRERRGLSDETIRAYGLGYNPDWTNTNYLAWNEEAGRKRRVRLAPGIVIPWIQDNVVVALRIRCRVGDLAEALGVAPDLVQGEEISKYRSFRGSTLGGALFNADHVQLGGDVLLVEGEFDAMLASQILGDQVAVVTLGSATNRLTRRVQEALKDAERIFSVLDQDTAGQEATANLARVLGDRHRALRLSEGNDVTDFVVGHGGDLATWFTESARWTWWPGGIPDRWREAMMNILTGSAAALVELLNMAVHRGLINPQAFTPGDVIAANARLPLHVAETTIQRGLKTVENLFLETLPSTESTAETKGDAGLYRVMPLSVVTANFLAAAAPRINERHHPAQGRAAVLAPLTARMIKMLLIPDADAESAERRLRDVLAPAYAKQRDRLEAAHRRAVNEYRRLRRSLNSRHSTPLPHSWPLANGALYRTAYLRAVALARPHEHRTRRQIATMLGVEPKAVNAYLDHAGLLYSEQFEDQTLNPVDPAAQVEQIRRATGALPRALVAWTGGQRVEVPYTEAALRGLLRHQQAKGGGLAFRVRVRAEQTVARESPPPPVDWRRRSHANRAPGSRPYRGPDYDRDWLHGQLRLALALLGWDEDGPFYNPTTGRAAPRDADPRRLLELLVGRRIATGDPLLDEGLRLGASVRKVD